MGLRSDSIPFESFLVVCELIFTVIPKLSIFSSVVIVILVNSLNVVAAVHFCVYLNFYQEILFRLLNFSKVLLYRT